MSDIQLYLLEFDKDRKEASSIAAQSAKRLESKELKLLDLIESLGEYISHDDTATRAKADDHDVIGSYAKGLLALEERGKWDEERVASVINALLDNTHALRNYKQQSERYPVLQLIDTLMAKYRNAMKSVHDSSPQFMSRLINYFEGEKDPRNLMIVFSILKVPMTEWDIGSDAQDLFEAVFNYFPITFKPPPNDPYGITTQDLKDRLRDCISSTSDFAPYSFPALLDKLDSTSMNTKRDVLQTIIACVKDYGPRTISLYSVTLWDALKFEILNSEEEDLAQEALSGLSEIARSLSQASTGALNAYLKPIAKECNEHLEDAPTKQSQAAGRILGAIASVSPEVANMILRAVLPTLFTLYQAADNFPKRRGLIEVFVQLIRADLQVYGEWRAAPAVQQAPNGDRTSSADLAANNALLKFTDQALEVLSTGLSTVPVKEVSFRLMTLDALLQLAKVRQLLAPQEIAEIIKLFHTIVITEESYGNDELKAASVNGLVEIGQQKPQLIIDHAFPAFMAQLPDSDVDGSTTYVSVLEAFAKLGSERQLFETVVLRLRNKFNVAVQQQASVRYLRAILSAILFAFAQGANNLQGTPGSCPYYNDLILPLLKQSSGARETRSSLFEDEGVLDLIGRLSNVVLRTQHLEFQKQIARETYTLFRTGPAKDLPPFGTDAPTTQGRTMIVSTHVLAALQREAKPVDDINELLTALVNFAMVDSLSPKVRAATSAQVSLVVNKFIPTAELKAVTGTVLYAPTDLLNPANLTINSIRTIFAIIKGLVLRNHTTLTTIFPSLLALLSSPEHGTTVARGFSTLLQPDDLLTKENHCTISGLRKQKAFSLLVPNISTSVRSATDASTKANYLIALSGILRWLPYTIIEPEISALSPLLLQSLDLPPEEHEVKSATLDTLITFLTQNPRAIEEHASSLITRLLATTSEKRNPAKVRAAALQCLALVPGQLRTETVLPFRKQVAKRLMASLDDGKRAVRGEAVRCRARWMGMDEVEDEEDE
ncbi:hypothetical protein W97_01237 [Coniosporium apollinis CBS 100218]|uniref:MMS19 nucleotide excision repair protein n=1 Tax=Coniosporium apollinis (strain CBS 100218) TaxID=1168221 RepID=R7YJG6_CONA1|nr:uncharacterized protein W97_01237 [Coniosporium apollinis CBS 100218]EON62018.1 hypothetical protein W97_01237 [Coniosporium apollinis CBS 100218]